MIRPAMRMRESMILLSAIAIVLASGGCFPTDAPSKAPSHGDFSDVKLSADLVWADDGYVYFVKYLGWDQVDSQLWRIGPNSGATLFLGDDAPGCPFRSFRSLHRLAGHRISAILECGGDAPAGTPVMIGTDDKSVSPLPAQDGIDNAVWSADASHGWVQFQSDGCVAIGDSRAPLPAVPAYRPGILPTVDDETLYFFTSRQEERECHDVVLLDLCRLSGGELDRLGSFTAPKALTARDGRVLVAAARDGQEGLWLIADGATSLLAAGEFRGIAVSANPTTVIGIGPHGKVGLQAELR